MGASLSKQLQCRAAGSNLRMVKPSLMSVVKLPIIRLYPKLDFLKTECVERKPDIVCLTETWLDNSITNDELSIPGLNLIRLDRNRRGGGVALYININFVYKVIYLGDDSFECIIVLLVAVKYVFVYFTDLLTVLLIYLIVFTVFFVVLMLPCILISSLSEISISTLCPLITPYIVNY